MNFIYIKSKVLFLFLFMLSCVYVDAQNISYGVDVTNLYSSECGDCAGDPDYQYWIRLYQNVSTVANWNPYYEQSCGTLNRSNYSFYDNSNATYSTYINLQFDAEEQDNFFCGGNDGDCGGYASPNGNQTLNSTTEGVWHSYSATRSCSGVTWIVYYRFQWNFLPLVTPPAPTSYGSACGLGLNATTSTQTAVQWYWQTSQNGTDQTYAANNPPAVPNGTTTYYLRPYGINSGQWGTASAGLSLTKTCNFWCHSESASQGQITADWLNSGISPGNGNYQQTLDFTNEFAANSLIVDVNSSITGLQNNIKIEALGINSTSLVNGLSQPINYGSNPSWIGGEPNTDISLAYDNTTTANTTPPIVSVEVCACKPASYGSISSSTGSSACPDEVFTLTHNGSVSLRTDGDGYGEELRWFTSGCGSGFVGSGLTLNVTGPGTSPTAVTYYAQFYTNGVACGGCESYTITYVDNTNPVVVCPVSQTDVLDGNCQWLVPDYRSLATISDNCVDLADLTITQSPVSGSLVPSSDGATETVTITANDGFGNSQSCSFGVVLSDNVAPVTLCQDYTLNLNALGTATLTTANIDNGSSDNCSTPTLSLSKTVFTCSDVGPNTVTLTSDDGNGQTSTCTATVTVVDNINPTAICQNYNLVLDGTGNGTLTTANIDNGSNDACGIASLSLSKTAFTCADVGSNTVTLTVTDNNLNLSTCNATVTVQEAAPSNASAGPDIFTCHGDNVTLAANVPVVGTGLWSWVGPGTVSYVSGTASSPVATVSFSTDGVYTGTWTITSNCNSSSDDVEISLNLPDVVTTTAGANGQCSSNNVDDWVHIFDNNGNIIASVDDNMATMGLVNVTVPTVGNASPSGVCNSTTMNAYMGRYFRFFSTNTTWFNVTDVTVRLYFTTAELNSLIAASHTTSTAPTNDPNGCEDDDDVNTIADIVATKYTTGSGPGGGGEFLPQVGNGFDASFNAHYVDFTVDGFSDFYLHGSEHGKALPVELVDFTAKSINNRVIELDWLTATEINNEGFELQRSTDGVTFNKIAWIDGNGNTNEQQAYSFEDENVSTGVYYYRLKQIDFDGEFEFSPIKSAAILGKEGISLSFFIPNPTFSATQLDFSLVQSEKVSISVVDNLGRLVESKEVQFTKGKHSIAFDTKEYAAGIYTAKILIGNEEFTRRLVVRK